MNEEPWSWKHRVTVDVSWERSKSALTLQYLSACQHAVSFIDVQSSQYYRLSDIICSTLFNLRQVHIAMFNTLRTKLEKISVPNANITYDRSFSYWASQALTVN